jgi:hypothetical protein
MRSDGIRRRRSHGGASRPSQRRPTSTPRFVPARERRTSLALGAATCDRVVTTLGWLSCVLATGVLLWFALACHPVGDYQAESDFYGGYVVGARAIQHWRVDPGRYSVIGPVYEFALALVAAALGDAFLSARIISVAAYAAILSLWFLILRHRVSAVGAVWTVLFLAANPVLFRYGYSATTDMLSCALQAASLYFLLARSGMPAVAASGALAAIATLTRYNSVALVPPALLYIGLTTRASRARSIAWYVGGFSVAALPWLTFSLSHGAVPGATLIQKLAFYRDPTAGRNSQDALVSTTIALPRHGETPMGVVLGALRNSPEHFYRDGVESLGWPIATLGLGGLLLALRTRVRRRIIPLAAIGAAMFLGLAPVFYSSRYSLAILPFELAFAGVALGATGSSRRLGRFALPVALALGSVLLGFSLIRNAAEQINLRRDAPVETLVAGRELDRVAAPTSRVMSRKGHIGYYSGRDVVPFPRFATLGQLGDYARRTHADYLFYSWYETGLRPEFRYLLDTSAVVPGLHLVCATSTRPSALYHIGPDFGREPGWMRDSFQVALHSARAMVTVLPDSEAATYRTILAVEAMARGATSEGLALAERATRDNPHAALAWVVQGDAHRLQHRLDLAQSAYERALDLDPQDLETQLALGEVQLERGLNQRASATLLPLVGRDREPAFLVTLDSLLTVIGDHDPAHAARIPLMASRVPRVSASSSDSAKEEKTVSRRPGGSHHLILTRLPE